MQLPSRHLPARTAPLKPVVVVPVYRSTLEPSERIGLAHLEEYLSRHPRVLVTPSSLQFDLPGFGRRTFSDSDFASVSSYSALLLSRRFYEAFADFTHVLIYQLDAVVFSDQLLEWCARDIDYVGAPWFPDPNRPDWTQARTGNGGLSLRRIEACLRVLDARVGRDRLSIRGLRSAAAADLRGLPLASRVRSRVRIARELRLGAAEYASRYTLNEDRFWGDRAALFDPSFRVAAPEDALAFAFEAAPRSCFERLGRLPFGCHAWSRWDREFWRPHLIAPRRRPAPPMAKKPVEPSSPAARLPIPPPERLGWPWDPDLAPPPPEDRGGHELPTISIVIPSFNQGRYLEETLRSILLQGYPRLELYVIDGGSRDETLDVLRRYDPWITHWISAPDKGQSAAINRGLALCTGELMTFFGADDIYLPGAFWDVARRWPDLGGSGALVGAFRYTDSTSRLLSGVRLPLTPPGDCGDLSLHAPGAYRLHQVSTFFTRRALDELGRFVRQDLVYTMDRELLYRVSRRFPIAKSHLPYAAFRLHPSSKSGSKAAAFSAEMARLQRELPTIDRSERIRRVLMDLHHRSRYWIKKAQAHGPPLDLLATRLLGPMSARATRAAMGLVPPRSSRSLTGSAESGELSFCQSSGWIEC